MFLGENWAIVEICVIKVCMMVHNIEWKKQLYFNTIITDEKSGSLEKKGAVLVPFLYLLGFRRRSAFA